MRNNKNKGFTLVELLVVIAILAILATVSVVGYTSFIESATVSNDENIAAQLNNFLVAMKADSNGPFYGEDINEDNIWEVTQYILEDSGLNDLDPQAGKYNYHFYFDLAEGKYVVLNDKEAIDDSILSVLMNAFAAEEKVYSEKPGNYFTKDSRYFLVDTKGSIAEFLTKVYNFNGSASELHALYTEAATLTNSKGDTITAFAEMIKETVFITDAGTVVVNTADTHTMLVVSNKFSTGIIGSEKVGSDGSIYMDANNPLITVDKDVVIRIPSNVAVFGGSLHIAVKEGTTPNITIHLGNNTWDNFDANFTGTNVKLVMNGAEYEMKDSENVHKYVAGAEVGDFVENLGAMNPMTSFEVEIRDLGNVDNKIFTKAVDGKNNGFMAWDKEAFYVHIINASGDKEGLPVSSTAVNWSTSETLIKINEAGLVSVPDTDALLASAQTEFVVTATPVDGEADPVNFKICVVKIASAKVGFNTDGADDWTIDENVNIIYNKEGEEFGVSLHEVTYNYNDVRGEIVLDEEIAISYACGHSEDAGCPHVNGNAHSANKAVKDECEICTHTHSASCTDVNCTHNHNASCTEINCKHSHGWNVLLGIYSNNYCNMCTHDCDTHGGDGCGLACDHYGKTCAEMGDCGHTSTTEHPEACCKHYQGDHPAACCEHTQGTHYADGTCLECKHEHDADCRNHTSIKENITGTKITITSKCADCYGDLTIKVGHFNWGDINLSFTDFSKSIVMPNANITNYNNYYVGNGNTIKIGDLFGIRGDAAATNLPVSIQGAQLVIFKSNFDDSKYMSKDYGSQLEISDGTVGVLGVKFSTAANLSAVADDGSYTYTISSLNDELQFFGTTSDKLYVAIYDKNGTRLSVDVAINIVDAHNVRTYEDVIALMNKETSTTTKDGTTTIKRKDKSNTLTKSIVFLRDITMNNSADTTETTEDAILHNFITIPYNKVLYGNCYEFDIKAGRESEEGIIYVAAGKIQDVKIVGKVYPDLALSAGDQYGSSAVRTSSTSKTINGVATVIPAVVENCYISNTRSPMRVQGDTIVKDTVLFGGRYSNMDLISGTTTIQGTVTTIQQRVMASNGKTTVMGVGISAWYGDYRKYINIDTANGGELIQYNFMDESMASELPTISLKKSLITIPVMDLSVPFKDIFSPEKDTEYGPHKYTGEDGTKYVNSGIVATDKYMFDYRVSNDNSTVTVSIIPDAHNEKATFNILYNPDKYVEVTDDSANYEDATGHDSDGLMILKDQTLKLYKEENGEIVKDDKGKPVVGGYTTYTFKLVSGSFNSFDFLVYSNDYLTINVDTNISGSYSQLEYIYPNDMSGTLASAESLLVDIAKTNGMHARGIHYGYLTLDIWTPDSTERTVVDAEGNETFVVDQRLAEYLVLGTYYQDSYDFDSTGHLKTFTQYQSEQE